MTSRVSMGIIIIQLDTDISSDLFKGEYLKLRNTSKILYICFILMSLQL